MSKIKNYQPHFQAIPLAASSRSIAHHQLSPQSDLEGKGATAP